MSNKWTNEQNLAINSINSNILVSASAGSGKTAVLVERVITKVLKYNVDIDKLLVVTFTNASAVELKERLLEAIYKNLEKDPKNLFLKRQLNLLNRANITTIHAFCLELIKSNFFCLDIDPNFKICDETESSILKNKAIETILESKYMDVMQNENNESEKNTEEKITGELNNFVDLYKILELFAGKDEELVSYILRIYSYIQSFDYPFKWLKNQIEKYNIDMDKIENIDLIDTDFGKQIYEDTVAQINIILQKYIDLREEIAVYEEFEKFTILIDKEIEMLKKCVNDKLKTWDNLFEKLREVKFDRAPQYKGNNVVLKEKVASFRTKIAKKNIEILKDNIYEKSIDILKDNKVAYSYIVYLYEFLLLFDSEYKRLKNERNLIDFNDIEHLALNLLIEFDENGNGVLTEIAKNQKERFTEVYTDEYQDTSFIQEMILNAVSKENNRFMVGDIKQSIYKFRQAMPEIFRGKYESFELLENLNENEDSVNNKIILSKNFRSRKNVIESINYIFEQIMTNELGDANYLKGENLKLGATYYADNLENDYATEVNIIDVLNNTENEVDSVEEFDNDLKNSILELKELKNFEIEAKYVAKKIKDVVENFKVFDSKKNEFRKCKYKDIVILVRNQKNCGNVLEKILKENDIPAFSDSNSSLFEGEEIKLVMSFLKIIDNPLNDISMISLMYSIIGGFSLSELVYIRNYDKKLKIYEVIKLVKKELENKSDLLEKEQEILNKLNNYINILEFFMNYSKKYSISELLVRIYKETNIYYQFALEELANIKKANLNYLIDLTIRYEKNNINSLSRYIEYIDNLKEKSDDSTGSAKMLGENEDVVRIMTIHKSKGLEFPVVILCDTAKKYNFRDNNSPIITHHKFGVGINIVNEELNITYPSVIKQAIKSAKIKETKAEELRMLYVALTRAKEKLIIFGTLSNYEKKKNDQYIIYKDEIIDPTIVEKNNSYFENIIMSLNKYEIENNEQDNENKKTNETKKIFKINIIEPYKELIEDIEKIENENSEENNNELDNDEKNEELNEKNNESKEEKSDKDIFKNKNINDLMKIINKNIDLKNDEIVEKITENTQNITKELDYKYLFSVDITTPQRVSVSELKKADIKNKNINVIENENKEEKEVKNELNIINNFLKPECIDEKEEKIIPVKKGNLIHFVLENLEYKSIEKKQDLEKYLNNLIEKNILTISDLKLIDANKIYKFLESKLGKELKNSKEIYKEVEFVLEDETISNSIIQGIIDLYYINEKGNIILVDFKTDKISNKEQFLNTYKKQLEIYRNALEKLTNLEVETTYIYSFNLDTEIEIK